MARPTNDPKTESIRVRINEEQAAWCVENGGYTKAVRRLIDEAMGNNKKAGKSHLEPEQDDLNFILSDIGQMAKLTGGTLEGLLDDLRRRMESGEIGVDGGRITIGIVDECPFDWRKIVEVCEDTGTDYEYAVQKLVNALFKKGV